MLFCGKLCCFIGNANNLTHHLPALGETGNNTNFGIYLLWHRWVLIRGNVINGVSRLGNGNFKHWCAELPITIFSALPVIGSSTTVGACYIKVLPVMDTKIYKEKESPNGYNFFPKTVMLTFTTKLTCVNLASCEA